MAVAGHSVAEDASSSAIHVIRDPPWAQPGRSRRQGSTQIDPGLSSGLSLPSLSLLVLHDPSGITGSSGKLVGLLALGF